MIAAALPGSTTADVADELAAAWRAGIGAWCTEVEDFAAAIAAAAAEAREADQDQVGRLGGLLGGGP